MSRRSTSPVVVVSLMLLVLTAAYSARPQAQDAKAVVAEAVRAMGMSSLSSISYQGTAAVGNFGQSRGITFGLASSTIRDYIRTIDFAKPAMHATGQQYPMVPRGGKLSPTAIAAPYDEAVSSATPTWDRQLEIWTTPWGFLKGALAAPDTKLTTQKLDGVPYRVLSWSPPLKAPSGRPYRVNGYVNQQGVIDKVETWVDHPVFGDMHVEVFFTQYADAEGVKVPVKIARRLGGMETFVESLVRAQINPSDAAELLQAPPPPSPPAPRPLTSERLSDGVYRLTGDYVSLLVEFKDYVVVLEAGENEARGLAVLAEAKRLFPSKRVKYVVNTHPHFDHVAGLVAFIPEGITVITDDNNKFFVEASFSEPRTLLDDLLARKKKTPKVEGVIDDFVLKDTTRELRLHHVDDLEHSEGMLIAYLPAERILFTADFDPPLEGHPVDASIPTLLKTLDRLKIDFDRHVTVHPLTPDHLMTRDELLALGRAAERTGQE